jgi:hypothetical protein
LDVGRAAVAAFFAVAMTNSLIKLQDTSVGLATV